ncbi:MAG: alpha/beta hydrolase [Eubacteriales bacterium]|nr:alpha/beta hydrolase [Eubacteriales bacterium]
MIERIYNTAYGDIHYWISKQIDNDKYTLVFLPGLTADHRLFDKQVEYFEDKVNVFVWDAPGHAASWPFQLTFSLMHKAKWLHDILKNEGVEEPVMVGQSMGGYVGQAFIEQFPGELKGFISIDSAPLQRKYVTAVEIWLLKRMEPVYRHYPWKSLLKSGCNGVATSEYGRKLMHDMMMSYDGDQERYAKLSGHGFAMLAEAMEADLPYKIDCPVMLICGEHDQAGSTKRYNKEWHKRSGIVINWIAGAGHNSNTDKPKAVNALIAEFIDNIG